MTIAIGTYIQFLERDGGATGYNFQNFHQAETRLYNGAFYIFAGFGFSGGTLDIEAGSVTASLVFALTEPSLVILNEAVINQWLITVNTVWLDPETFEEGAVHSEELYTTTGLDHDVSRVSVRLGNPLDAVSQNAPRRVLTQKLVGSLPSTGNINLS